MVSPGTWQLNVPGATRLPAGNAPAALSLSPLTRAAGFAFPGVAGPMRGWSPRVAVQVVINPHQEAGCTVLGPRADERAPHATKFTPHGGAITVTTSACVVEGGAFGDRGV